MLRHIETSIYLRKNMLSIRKFLFNCIGVNVAQTPTCDAVVFSPTTGLCLTSYAVIAGADS
jgi:hypothetical protein